MVSGVGVHPGRELPASSQPTAAAAVSTLSVLASEGVSGLVRHRDLHGA